MAMIRQRAARMWHPPGRFADRDDHRPISFLELFYDLVFVALIAEIAGWFAHDISLEAGVRAALMFVAAWWAWVNGALYHNNHATNDLSIRLFTFAQMATVASMAISVSGAWGGETRTAMFAGAYAAHHAILAFMWARTGWHDETHRHGSRPYSLGMLALAAAAVCIPWLPTDSLVWAWGAMLTAETVFPLLIRNRLAGDLRITGSLVERMGLLVIIMLGEVVIGIVHTMSGASGSRAALLGALGMLGAVGLWWVYFDFISHRQVRRTHASYWGWMYGHLPLMIALAMCGAAARIVIEPHSAHDALEAARFVSLAAGATLLIVAGLRRTLDVEHAMRFAFDRGAASMVVCAAGTAIASATIRSPTALVATTVAILLVPVAWTLWLLSGHDHQLSDRPPAGRL